MTTSNGAHSYTVSVSGAVEEQIRALARLAGQAGRGRDVLVALQFANQQLQADPHNWGDRLRDYRQAGLSEYRAMHPVLIIHYGVHETSRTVFVRDVRLNPYFDLGIPGKE